MTKNDWLKHNLQDRLLNPQSSLVVTLNPGNFQKMSFDDACDYTARQIYNDLGPNLYLALSGGYDSEFVYKVFKRNNIPIIPIVVLTGGNKEESEYAFRACPDPAIIGINEQTVLKTYYTEIYQKLNSYGINSVPILICSEYAKQRGGNLVIGEHLIDGTIFQSNDWDYYSDVIYDNKTAGFFVYTPEISYAMAMEIEGETEVDWKEKLYKAERRPILKYKYSSSFYSVLNSINNKRKVHANPTHCFGDKQQFLLHFR